jgi:hypothetical protein
MSRFTLPPSRPPQAAMPRSEAPPSEALASAEQDGDTPALAAEAAFQAAQLCVRRKQFSQAERFARRACEHDRGSAEYLALHAWVRMQGGEHSSPTDASQIMAALNRAVLKERASVSIRFYRAQVLKRLGRHEDAYKDFVFVARRQPGNLDALREVRLHQMRLRNKQKSSGVFSKLFLR